jgi:hypothetical protein
MKDSSLEVLNKELHARAEELAKEYVDEFAATLLLQSKLLAGQDEIVLAKHVEEARQIINRERKKAWLGQLLIVPGKHFVWSFHTGFHKRSLRRKPTNNRHLHPHRFLWDVPAFYRPPTVIQPTCH